MIVFQGKTQSCLMTTKEMQVVVEGTDEDDWIKLNNDFIGYYRVQYQPEYLLRFQKDCDSKKLGELNRCVLYSIISR